MVNRIIKEKADRHAVRAIDVTVKAVWQGAKVQKDKAGAYTFKVKGTTISNEHIATMDDCVARNLSLRDTYIREMVGQAEDTRTDAEKYAAKVKGLKAWLKKEGLTEAGLIAALQAK